MTEGVCLEEVALGPSLEDEKALALGLLVFLSLPGNTPIVGLDPVRPFCGTK